MYIFESRKIAVKKTATKHKQIINLKIPKTSTPLKKRLLLDETIS